jgi:single-stranded DNA-binding protein
VAQAERSEAGEPEPIQLTGRLGRDPWFSADGDTLTGGFPLAVNDDTGKTTWHRVVVSGEAADQLQEASRLRQLRKGRLVEVTGREVVQQEDNARGGKRTSREFHASTVTRLTASKPQPRRT